MKKMLSFIFSLLTLFTCVMSAAPVTAAEQTEDIVKTQIMQSDTYYSFDAQTKTLTVSGTGAIPDFTNSSGASNSQPWYSYRSTSVEHVVVEEGITALGEYCFYNVSKADFSLPTTLVSIGKYSMASTSANVSVTLHEGLEEIGTYAFKYSRGLTSLHIPSTVTSIGGNAFEGCSALESVTFAGFNMNISIGSKAFLTCKALTAVTVPKRAQLGTYCFGYEKASAGYVYDGFLMRVYRDSPAYTEYLKANTAISYELIGTSEIFEGDSVDCTYYSDSTDSVMTFAFTPSVSASYEFYSEGTTYVNCSLKDSSGTELDSALCTDSVTDFKLIHYLEAGAAYYFDVTSDNKSTGDFTVTLLPYTVEKIILERTSVEISALDNNRGVFDVAAHMEGSGITVVYDTGYTDYITYSKDMTYRDYAVTYSDSQSQSIWSCGEHTASIDIGGAAAQIYVNILHSYTGTTIEPTYTEKGYTVYTCALCRDMFYADYVNSIGLKITGRIVLMQSPDGSHQDNIPVPMTKIGCDGTELGMVADDGTFSYYVDSSSQEITVYGEYGLTRTVRITPDENNEMHLGDVAFFHFDYNSDGYVNAKDYAILRTSYGGYTDAERDSRLSRDYNQDGRIDDSDWIDVGAPNFYTCGKITQEIY